MKVSEFTARDAIRFGSTFTNRIQSGLYELESGAEGIAVKAKSGAVVIVPWSNVTQFAPLAEEKKK